MGSAAIRSQVQSFCRETEGQRLLQAFQGESQGHQEDVACHFPSHDKWQDFCRCRLCSLVTTEDYGHLSWWHFLSEVYTLNASKAKLQYRSIKYLGLEPNKATMEGHLLGELAFDLVMFHSLSVNTRITKSLSSTLLLDNKVF